MNKELEIPIRNPLKVLIDFKCICEEVALFYAISLAGRGVDVCLIEAYVQGQYENGSHML